MITNIYIQTAACSAEVCAVLCDRQRSVNCTELTDNSHTVNESHYGIKIAVQTFPDNDINLLQVRQSDGSEAVLQHHSTTVQPIQRTGGNEDVKTKLASFAV